MDLLTPEIWAFAAKLVILYLTNSQVSVALLQIGDLLDKFLVRTAKVKRKVTVEISDNTKYLTRVVVKG